MLLMNFTGKPYAGKPHVRFDEGAGKEFFSFPLYSTEKYRSLIPQIWNLAAENGHGRNLFVKTNSPAFALAGIFTKTT
jgi:hypothetical protein